MGTFTSILVPIDGSSNSKRVLLYAGNLSELFKARVGILYVVSIPKILPVFDHIHTGAYVPAQALEDSMDAGRAIVNEALGLLPPTVEANAFVETGVPSDVIVKFCHQNNYDLIVIGRRGLGKFQEFVLGSVSKYVMEHASCPVMVIK